ncbi:hypothetical protein [Paenirhodobacter hankyongi]|uniref:Uncharacterized protein n=1 Tax=Paenirhodobacter hankyongi TaxID=2294033 RepID=A0A421BK44_9RHOB|nr:hypothetical protein [Sinirhodobacter hankyongi]RLL62688.1 hypothetical protein DYS74_16450 [Sinirhodobacter hankyongi]
MVWANAAEEISTALIPLDADPQAADPVYLQSRCRDFVTVVQALKMIAESNPVTGRNAAAGAAFEWATRVDGEASFPLAVPRGEDDGFGQIYLDAFSPIDARTPEPKAAIYARDKATCAPLLKMLR